MGEVAVQLRDGAIWVVNYGDENQLGGKLIDWEIVEQLLIPALVKARPLKDFKRGNRKWIAATAKLKWHAELAKFDFSRQDAACITIDYLCKDDRGENVGFDFELKRADVEKLTESCALAKWKAEGAPSEPHHCFRHLTLGLLKYYDRN
jgi:molecular chaperone DnaK